MNRIRITVAKLVDSLQKYFVNSAESSAFSILNGGRWPEDPPQDFGFDRLEVLAEHFSKADKDSPLYIEKSELLDEWVKLL